MLFNVIVKQRYDDQKYGPLTMASAEALVLQLASLHRNLLEIRIVKDEV